TIHKPRLLAAGADVGRVRPWPGDGFYLDHDIPALKAFLSKHPKIKLVVFDPLGDHITATSYAKVRKVMGALRDLAREMGLAVIGTGHPPKGLPHPKDAFGGSRAFPTVARAFWFVAKDDCGNKRTMLWVKGNLSALRTGLDFEAAAKTIKQNGKTIEA